MQMISSLSSISRLELHQALEQCRAGTFRLVAGLEDAVLCAQAHPDFSPLGWHLGHIAFTESLWILENLMGLPPQFPEYRCLFAADGLPKHARVHLPSLGELRYYLDTVRQQVQEYLAIAPLAEQARLWYWLLQHESQHNETMSIILELHQRQSAGQWPSNQGRSTVLSSIQPSLLADNTPTSPETRQQRWGREHGVDDAWNQPMIYLPAGEFAMGNATIAAAIDNEAPVQQVVLGSYWIDRYPVTCRDYGQFMAAGGYHDRCHWSDQGWQWLQSQAENGKPISQPLYWQDDPHWDDCPVSGVSWYEAEAYARFMGKRLPTEAEWERAALGASPGNHDRQYGHTTPVQAHSSGQSHAGCCDMLGNVWEWTDSWFLGYNGFNAYPYPGYSQAYFDHKHRVLRGGSWATRPWAIRTTVRNWYHPSVRQVLAGFRCAKSAE